MSRFARKRGSSAWLALLLGAMSTWTSASRAEPESERGSVSTTEDALVKTALANNPELRAGQWERNVAEAQVSTASALNNPVLRLEWLHAQDGDPIAQNGTPSASGWAARLSWTPPQPTEWSARRAQAQARTVEVEHELLERAADSRGVGTRRVRDRRCAG